MPALNRDRSNRRQFLQRSGASLSMALLLKACKQGFNSASDATKSDREEPTVPLESISVPPASGQTPTGVIVALHGFGANARDLQPLAPVMNLPNYQFLFLEAPFPYPGLPGGRMWYDLYGEDREGLNASRQKLADWLQSLESRTGLPLSRTILSGFSQGGAMTIDVGLSFPLAGLVSLSGFLHGPLQPKNPETLPPALLVHGRQDQVVPLAEAQRARDSLEALAVEVTYREFNMGHEITPEVLALVRDFARDVLP